MVHNPFDHLLNAAAHVNRIVRLRFPAAGFEALSLGRAGAIDHLLLLLLPPGDQSDHHRSQFHQLDPVESNLHRSFQSTNQHHCHHSMNLDTIFSPDRIYRYTLWREWGTEYLDSFGPSDPHHEYLPGRPEQFVQFIGLNPSTADEKLDDPTIRRCIRFAKDWGYGALCMTNLFAFRATDPDVMINQGDKAIGPENTAWILKIARHAGKVICAWGTDGTFLNRGNEVLSYLAGQGTGIYCLGQNSDGTPKHPLYLRKDSLPRPLD